MKESALQLQVMRVLKQMGIFYLRINSGKVKVRGAWMNLAPEGTADLVVFPEAKCPIWIELKTLTGKQGEAQAGFCGKVTLLGHQYHVVRSIDDLEPLLEGMR